MPYEVTWIGAYLPPSTLDNLPDLEENLARIWDQYPIVLGYLDAIIGQYQNPHIQQVADLLMEFGLVDLLHHFLQHWRFHQLK